MSDGRQDNKNDLGHGTRLTLKEYEKHIVELYSGLPSSLSKEEKINIHQRELNLTIDHRLGQDFPKDRREALWAIQQRVEKRRFRLMFQWLLHFISYRWLYSSANKLAGYLVDEYAKVLTKEELQAFFELRENERPTLPIEKF
jgi:hypothetical protein